MQGGELHLREYRLTRSRRWRLPLVTGLVILVIGVAALEPLAPTVFAPSPLVALAPAPAAVAVPEAPAVVQVLVAPAAPAKAAPLALPTVAPIPTVAPTLSPSALDFLAKVRGELTARWLKNHAETALRSGPNDQAQTFTMLPQWSTLRVRSEEHTSELQSRVAL